MPVFGFNDSDGIDVGNKYLTKDYVARIYPNLIPAQYAPALMAFGVAANYAPLSANRSSPSIAINGGGTNWEFISAYSEGGAGIKSDGTLWTWGRNVAGEVGDGTVVSRFSPVQTAGAGTNWKQVACGYRSMAAIKTDGTLWTWGSNASGQLGDNTVVNRSSPGTTAAAGTNWKQVSIGSTHVAAIKTDGTLWTWGENLFGRLGNGTTTLRSSPDSTAGAGTTWKNVLAIRDYTMAIKTDGTLWTWGGNAFGQLGDNSTTSRSSPNTTSGGGTNWKTIPFSSLGNTSGAIKTDGTLWTWGSDAYGTLGTGTLNSSRSSPGTTAGGGANWRYVAFGITSGGGSGHSVAVKTDGTLWTWGKNNSGQLGSNDLNNRSSPGSAVTPLGNWRSIACGYNWTIATTESGDW